MVFLCFCFLFVQVRLLLYNDLYWLLASLLKPLKYYGTPFFLSYFCTGYDFLFDMCYSSMYFVLHKNVRLFTLSYFMILNTFVYFVFSILNKSYSFYVILFDLFWCFSLCVLVKGLLPWVCESVSHLLFVSPLTNTFSAFFFGNTDWLMNWRLSFLLPLSALYSLYILP